MACISSRMHWKAIWDGHFHLPYPHDPLVVFRSGLLPPLARNSIEFHFCGWLPQSSQRQNCYYFISFCHYNGWEAMSCFNLNLFWYQQSFSSMLLSTCICLVNCLVFTYFSIGIFCSWGIVLHIIISSLQIKYATSVGMWFVFKIVSGTYDIFCCCSST